MRKRILLEKRDALRSEAATLLAAETFSAERATAIETELAGIETELAGIDALEAHLALSVPPETDRDVTCEGYDVVTPNGWGCDDAKLCEAEVRVLQSAIRNMADLEPSGAVSVREWYPWYAANETLGDVIADGHFWVHDTLNSRAC